MPHIHCYLGDAALTWSMVITDTLIGLSYLAISLTLYALLRKSKLPFSGMIFAFGVFILACGITHFVSVYNLWIPRYWVSVGFKVITVLASVTTAAWLFLSRDKILKVADTIWTDANASSQEKKTAELNLKQLADFLPQLAWMANPDGWIFWYNQRWYDYTGTTLKDMEGWGWEKVHDPVELKRMSVTWRRALETGEPWEDKFPLRSKTGEMRWFLTRANPIRDNKGRIVRWFGTNTDIQDAKITEENLNLAKDAAEYASKTKSAFLANMSHEIRTPLGAIMGFVDLLRQPTIDKQEFDNYIDVISRNSKSLLRIIDDILDLSKVEAGKMTIEKIDFSLPEMIGDFYSLMGLRARNKQIEFLLTANTNLPKIIHSDPTRIRQILMNVVGNAIKFTEKGRVELAVSFRDSYLEFKVTDTGTGISEEQAAKLFQPFTQADTSTTRKFGGTGLGLVLTRTFAAALKGDFWLESSELGKGSVFIAKVKVDLPESTEFINQPDFVFSKDAVEVSNAAVKLQGIKVLLADDASDNRTLISLLLTKAGAEVTAVENGQLAIDLAMKTNYDVILMDIQMPVMDGYEATRLLRESNIKTPILALTAHAMKDERDRALSSGFTDFVPKPIHRSELISIVRKYKKN